MNFRCVSSFVKQKYMHHRRPQINRIDPSKSVILDPQISFAGWCDFFRVSTVYVRMIFHESRFLDIRTFVRTFVKLRVYIRAWGKDTYCTYCHTIKPTQYSTIILDLIATDSNLRLTSSSRQDKQQEKQSAKHALQNQAKWGGLLEPSSSPPPHHAPKQSITPAIHQLYTLMPIFKLVL